MGWSLFLAGFADLLSLLIIVSLVRPMWRRRRESPVVVFLCFLISLAVVNLNGLAGRVVDSLALTLGTQRVLLWQEAIYNLWPLGDTAAFLITIFWLHFFLVYPEPHPWLHRRRWLPVLFYVPAGLFSLFGLSKLFLRKSFWAEQPALLYALNRGMLLLAGLALVVGFVFFLRSYLRVQQGQARLMLRSLLLGFLLVEVLVLLGYVVPELLQIEPLMQMYPLLQSGTLLLLIGTFGFAVVRYQLFKVHVVLRQGLAYASATLILLLLYVLLALGLVHLLGQPVSPDNPLLLVAFVLLVTVLLNPLRTWLQDGVDRLFYPQRYDYRRLVRQFGQDMSRLQELSVLMRLILDRAISSWGLRTAALILQEENGDPYLVRVVRGLPDGCRDFSFDPGGEVARVLAGHRPALEIQHEGEWLAHLPAREQEALASLEGLLLVPMLVKGKLIGWLHLGEKRSERPYTPDDIELFCTLADQAAVALENALLYERGRREVTSLEVLNRISLAASTLELDDLLEQIYREIIRLVDAPNFYIALYDEQEEVFSFIFYVREGVRRWPDEGSRWPLSSGLTSDIVRTKSPIVTPDYVVECERRGIQPRERSRGQPGLVWLGVPMMEGAQVIGVLCLSSSRPGTVYRPEHVRLLSTIAGQAAVVIGRAQLRKRERQRVVELETLNEIAQAIGSSLFLEELLQVICQAVQRILDAPNFYIALYNQERAEFAFAIFVEQDQRRRPPLESWPLGDGLTSEVVRLRRPVITDDYMSECERRGIQPGGRPGKAWLGVPIIVGETIIGVMVASSFNPLTTYSDEDVRLFSTIAAQAAGAIQNARLYQESRRRLEELASFFQVGTTIVSTLDLHEVMQIMCREAVSLLKATSAYYCDWDDEQMRSVVVAEYYSEEASPEERVSDLGVVYTEEHVMAGVLRGGQPQVMRLSDPDIAADMREHMEKYGGQSTLLLPLIARGSIFGYIEVWESRYERIFTDDEILLGQNLASQAAIALENARLYERTDAALARRVEELTVIEEIARELNMPLDFRQAIQVVLDRAMSYTGAMAGAVAMLTPNGQGLLLLSARGYPEEVSQFYSTHPWSVQKGITGRAIRGNCPVLVDDVRKDPDYAEIVSTTRSQLSVPIDFAGRPIGGISLESGLLAAFDQEELRFLQRLADHAAIAIHNARQYEAQVRQTRLLEQKTEQLTSLLQVGNAMRAQLDLPEVLQTVAEAVCRSLEFNMALLSLVDVGAPRYLKRVAGAGLSSEEYALLRDSTVPRDQYVQMMRPEFLLGRAYFLDHRYVDFTALWESEAPVHQSNLGERPEGEWNPNDVFFIPLVGSDGDLLGILSVDDPVDRRLPTLEVAEALELFANQAAVAIENARLFQQVIQARDRLQSILDSTQEGILMLNEEGIIQLANPPIERWIGLPRQEIIGQTLAGLVRRSPRGNVEVCGALSRAFRGKLTAPARETQAILHGTIEVSQDVSGAFEWMGLPVLDSRGEWIGRIVVIRDVTEAREAERMREDLTSMLVHDLRGPLTAFLGALETLLHKSPGPLTDVQHTLIDIAIDGGKQMLGMINTLLDIRRLEAGKMPLEFAPVRLQELVQVVVNQMEILAEESRLSLQVEIPDDLPKVWADTEKITRVLENLLHNAIKYSYPGGFVEVRGAEKEGMVWCAVVDHGVGIPKVELERIFDKFSQLHRPSAPRGSGLGLAFCRLAVEAQHGRIWVESEEGKGSSFYFALPIWEQVEA